MREIGGPLRAEIGGDGGAQFTDQLRIGCALGVGGGERGLSLPRQREHLVDRPADQLGDLDTRQLRHALEDDDQPLVAGQQPEVGHDPCFRSRRQVVDELEAAAGLPGQLDLYALASQHAGQGLGAGTLHGRPAGVELGEDEGDQALGPGLVADDQERRGLEHRAFLRDQRLVRVVVRPGHRPPCACQVRSRRPRGRACRTCLIPARVGTTYPM